MWHTVVVFQMRLINIRSNLLTYLRIENCNNIQSVEKKTGEEQQHCYDLLPYFLFLFPFVK